MLEVGRSLGAGPWRRFLAISLPLARPAIIAGLALALNIMPGLASATLAAVLVPTTVLGHPFWAAEGTARQEQLAHFIKNLAVLGGLVAMTVAVQ